MNIFNDRVFFILQKLIGNSTILISAKLRGLLYKNFFKNVGINFKVHDNVIIKLPSYISIGDNLTLNQNTYITGADGLSIGDNVMMGSGVKITTSKHMYDFIDIPMIKQDIINNPIVIEKDVWIGFNAVILDGVIIKEGSIVGANSLINRNIDKFCIYGGVPAKFIKNRTNYSEDIKKMDLN